MSSNNASKTETAIVLPKPARRVLPEHEGAYKIVLPQGTTQRSKEILAKRALRKIRTFGVLPERSEDLIAFWFFCFSVCRQAGKEQRIWTSSEKQFGGNGTVNSDNWFGQANIIRLRSVGRFERWSSCWIGWNFKKCRQTTGKLFFTYTLRWRYKSFNCFFFSFLQNLNPQQTLGGVTKKSVKQQKVILVQKRPAKAATMVADEYDDERHDIPEKSVSFSSEDEVLEIEARPVPKKFNMKKTTNVIGVKTRLGICLTKKNQNFPAKFLTICFLSVSAGLGTNKSQPINSLNRSRKVIQTKTDLRTITKSSSVKPAWSKMKSDLIDSKNISIKSRLTLKNRSAAAIAKSPLKTTTKKKETISSVFDRLGFNN